MEPNLLQLGGDFRARLLPNGSRTVGWLAVPGAPNDEPIGVPVLVARGHGEGALLGLVGGVHGNEADGIAALYDLWARIAVSSFRGSLLIIPIANVSAFRANARVSPLDGLDLNRICPGRADGTPTERLAAALTRLVLNNADFLFTLHGWYASGVATPHVEYDAAPLPTQTAAIRACHAAGFTAIVAADWPSGMLPKVAVEAGIPAIESEIGGQGAASSDNVVFMRSRIAALMRHLGMHDGAADADPESAAAPVCATGPRVTIDAASDGVFRHLAEIGQRVNTGQLLGHVDGLVGERLHDLYAPSAGMVLARCVRLWVKAGDNLFVLLAD